MRSRAAVAISAVLASWVLASLPAAEGPPVTAPAARAVDTAHTAPGAIWITLGTVGGPPLHGDVAPIAKALVVNGSVYLFDAGNGVLRQLDAAGFGARNLRGVFISHHHIDHNADLGLLIVQNWIFGSRKPVPVLGPQGTVAMVEGLVAAHAPTELASFAVAGPPNPPLRTAVAASDLPVLMDAPTLVYEDELVKVSAITVDHYQVAPVAPLARMPTAVAFRIEAGGRSFVYSGDTGRSPRLRRLAQGADVLISEVVDIEAITAALGASMPQASATVVKGIAGNMSANHLEPEVIGELAEAAGVRHVVLTHFVPALQTIGNPDSLRQRVASRFRGKVSLARDLERF